MSSIEILAQWVDVTVLGEEPLVDAEFITNFRTHHRICTSEEDEPKYELVVLGPEDRVCFGKATEAAPHFFYMYESMVTRLGVFLPFSDFEITVLCYCRVAPTKLHPNSWGFLKIYQFISHALDFSTSLRIFFYLFHMTKPFSGLNNKQQWVSFRAIQGGGSHFGVPPRSVEEGPYLNTKKFLQGAPTFVQTQLEMAKKNSSESYQIVQEAKARSRARAGGTRACFRTSGSKSSSSLCPYKSEGRFSSSRMWCRPVSKGGVGELRFVICSNGIRYSIPCDDIFVEEPPTSLGYDGG
ncbi:uncharacterized protein DS421_4g130780 [Arachis hypogaea]|nr:uncharacterized protein DS421_4g130780 [Arachis hypogaea]